MYGNQLNSPSADWTATCILDKPIMWVSGRRTPLALKPMVRKDQQHTPAAEVFLGSCLPLPPRLPFVSLRLSVWLHHEARRNGCGTFPLRINSWDRTRELGRSIIELNENIRDNQRILLLGKVKICSIRKATKVNYLVKLQKLLKSQTSVKGEHLRERKDE